jgi:hypothetical protein
MTASDHATKPLRNTLRERGPLGASDAGCDAPDDALAGWRLATVCGSKGR